MFNECLIMAGGSGTRLWPASSSRLPKQFLPAAENKSFFSMALERALALTTGTDGRVIVIAGKSHMPHVVADAAKLTAAEKKRLLLIVEPLAKNTAPAIACAVVHSILKHRAGKNMLVLTSDHIIKPLKTFKADAALAAAAAAENKLVVFGIPPNRPETGYGYIETGKGEGNLLSVKAFHEKPDLLTAKKYISKNRFFWNSGMFAFNTFFMAEQFYQYAPEVIKCFGKLKPPKPSELTTSRGVKILNTQGAAWSGLENAYKNAQSISFDYAIAEKCKKTAMVRTNFEWIDIGNWEEYAKIRGKSSSLVFNLPEESSCFVDSDIPVALAGVEDLIVVIRSGKNGEPATALITKKGQTQKVRDIVDLIKKSGKTSIL